MVFCLDRAGITGDDGASHHGVLDMVLLSKVPGMTIFAPSSYRSCRSDAARRPRPVHRRPGRHPLAQDHAARDDGTDEVGHGLTARKVRSGHRRLPASRVGKMLAAARTAADALAAEGVDGHGVGRPGGQAARPGRCSPTPPRHPLVVTVEDGYREGGIGSAIADQLERRPGTAPRPGRCWACPCSFIPHGKPDAILAELGLDADGVADAARTLLSSDEG